MAIIRLQSEYELAELDEYKLGTGGMGTVFKGRMIYSHTRKYEYVAIKILSDKLTEDGVNRAREEASIRIEHENLVRMYSFIGTIEADNRPKYYVVSEFLDGETLDSLLQREPALNRGSIYILSEFVSGNTIDVFIGKLSHGMRTEVVSHMMCAILDGLACLHRHHVWHRDIKPSNIMVEEGRLVKITDLGIAKADGKSFGTLHGSAIGTLAYASPEQINGRQDEVSHLSDIYSTGVTFYELLTGVNPFESGNYVETMERQISMKLPYDSRIPKPLYRVILKATAKNPFARCQSATEFKTAIENPPSLPDWLLYYMRHGFIH